MSAKRWAVQYLFDQTLSDSPRRSWLAQVLRGRLLRHFDPVVAYELHGCSLLLPLSHRLPYTRRRFALYGANVTRLCAFLRRRGHTLRMIDVGANVGDSYAVSGPANGDDSFLLVEGDATYFGLLVANMRGRPNVTCVNALLSDRHGTHCAELVRGEGNAQIVPATGSRRVTYTTLDTLIAEHSSFRACTLLKTDVEGMDGSVLRGAVQLIQAAQPVLFFEHYPRRIRALGLDPENVLDDLASLGYTYATIYDRFGYLLSSSHIHNRIIADLDSYAMQQDAYYDICCFPDSASASREEFLREEAQFFKSTVALDAQPQGSHH